MRRACFALLLLAVVPASAQEVPQNIYSHNGSTMQLVLSRGVDGTQYVEFRYLFPRPGLPVESGTILFSGTRNGSNVSGYARAFSRACPAIPYYVSGSITPDEHVVALAGYAPVRDKYCRVVGHSAAEPNGRLEFFRDTRPILE